MRGKGGPEGIFKRAHEEDDEALDHHDHVARDHGLCKGKFGAALIEQAEQHGRQHNAHGMGAPHEGHGNADKARAAHKLKHQAVLHAQHFIHRHEAGESAGNRHGDDDDAVGLDAGIDRGLGVGAHGADFIAKLGAPQQIPDHDRPR